MDAIGRAFARFLPWRDDARAEEELRRAAEAEPEPGELGLTRAFTESDVVQIDRALGICREVPRTGSTEGPGARSDASGESARSTVAGVPR